MAEAEADGPRTRGGLSSQEGRQTALAGAGKVELMLPAYVTDPSRERCGRDNAIEATAGYLQAVIAPLCRDGGPYALLDFPDHSNVGDSAIFLGELVLLRRLFGRNPSFVSSGSMFRKGWGRHTHFAGTIFIHGGGNLGDLWPGSQRYRESVMRDNRHIKTIQLPQSIHFNDQENLQQFSRIVGMHEDFTLLVRDRKSYSIACENFDCTVLMCPDAAYGLGRLERNRNPELPVLSLIRTDHETTGEDISKIREYGPVQDWLDDGRRVKSLADRLMRRVMYMTGEEGNFLMPRLLNQFVRMAEQRVARGINILSRAEFVVSDRLHAHIMSSLLGLPHAALDNNYGKISNFIDSWPLDSFTRRVKNIDEAIAVMSAGMGPCRRTR
ncbi:MAG: exopolysaccharide biosynthesis protein [Alphaproteobacteria bacterium]|nr:exopolysaccharide biosynthesis protein [Alphaproteobacteria bacterium]